MTFIAFDIAFDFLAPELGPRLGPLEMLAIVMVPKTAMDKNHCSIFRQDDVRFSWQVFPVQTKPEATIVQGPADKHLGFGVFTANP